VWVAALRATLITATLVSVGCTASMHSLQSSFFSKFSLRELVERSRSRSGLDCSTGGAGGGAGGGSVSGREFRFHRGESLSCRLSGAAESFDEAGFIAALKQDVEGDLRESGAEITGSGSPTASNFYFEYEQGIGRGRLEVTGRTISGGYYSLKAELDEKGKSESEPPR